MYLCNSNDGKETEYKEKHHILPKSRFEEYTNLSNNEWNCAVLKPRTHFIVHYILSKYSNMHSMKYAYWMMCNSNQAGEYLVSSFEYEQGRKLFSKARKGIGYKWSEESKKKFRRPKSKEHAENISNARKGIVFSDTHKENIRKARGKQVFSAESLEKRSKSISKLIWVNNGKRKFKSDNRKIQFTIKRNGVGSWKITI